MKKRIISVLLFAVWCLSGCSSEAASIGVIGGADGPTAIFVTSNTNWLNIGGFLAAAAVAIWVVVIIYNNQKKK